MRTRSCNAINPAWVIQHSHLLLTLLITLVVFHSSIAQQNDTTVNKKRLKSVIIGSSTTYSLSLIGLNALWYKNFERESFHFFNDNKEWKQMDKIGHFYSSYHIGQTGSKLFRWTNLEQQKSHFWGSMLGIIFLTPIEILDGFSSAYGASYGDLIANTAGAGFFLGQTLLWDEIKTHPKLSFSRSPYPHYRPNVLGKGLKEELLKDYNGQTYWLSWDIDRILKKGNRFPKWLNIATGYGAAGMVYADDRVNADKGFNSYRQYFVAIDFDFTHIKHKSRFINTLLYVVNLVHLPAPTLEIKGKGGIKFYGLYF